jgi:hypothetical protein
MAARQTRLEAAQWDRFPKRLLRGLPITPALFKEIEPWWQSLQTHTTDKRTQEQLVLLREKFVVHG